MNQRHRRKQKNFKESSFDLQAIPALSGDCPDNAVVTDRVKIESNRFDIFLDKGLKNTTAKNHYLFLKFSDFKGHKFRVVTHYDDRKKYPFDFKRSKSYQPEGIFFLEFDQESEKNLSSITLLMPEGSRGDVTARICRY